MSAFLFTSGISFVCFYIVYGIGFNRGVKAAEQFIVATALKHRNREK